MHLPEGFRSPPGLGVYRRFLALFVLALSSRLSGFCFLVNLPKLACSSHVSVPAIGILVDFTACHSATASVSLTSFQQTPAGNVSPCIVICCKLDNSCK